MGFLSNLFESDYQRFLREITEEFEERYTNKEKSMCNMFKEGGSMSDTVSTKKEKLQKVYERSCSEVRQVLNDLFPGECVKRKGRVSKGRIYWTIDGGYTVEIKEEHTPYDNIMWAIGNYFHTEEQAQLAAEGVKGCLKGYQKSFGIID